MNTPHPHRPDPLGADPAAAADAGAVPGGDAAPYDLLGVGIGPFNLSLAALADGVPEVRSLFCDATESFRWHPGLLVEGARMQVPFLADLVTLVDPTSRWSFLNYLRAHDRLYPFYFSERFHLPRREYDHYCRWVAEGLPGCRFGTRVTALHWDAGRGLLRAELRATATGATRHVRARNVVLGVGTRPVTPDSFEPLRGHPRVWHAARYLDRRAELDGCRDITVVGSGQSGAEVFLDLLRARSGDGTRLRWLTRSPAFAPMEYSKLGLEHFTPDYTRYFHALPAEVRDRLVPAQWQLYKAADAGTLGQIHDLLYEHGIGGSRPPAELLPGTDVRATRADPAGRPELHCHHRESGAGYTVGTDAVVLATGYTARRPELLDPIAQLVRWDAAGRYRVGLDHRVVLDPAVTAGLYVQNAELHTHGVGTPDLGLGAHRAATILNAVAGRTVHRLPARTAFTTFGPGHRAPAGATPSRAGQDADAPATRRAHHPAPEDHDRAAAVRR